MEIHNHAFLQSLLLVGIRVHSLLLEVKWPLEMLYEMCLRGIMVVAFIKTKSRSQTMNETATIPCRHFSEVKTLDSHRVSLHPGVQMGTGEFKAGGGGVNTVMD